MTEGFTFRVPEDAIIVRRADGTDITQNPNKLVLLKRERDGGLYWVLVDGGVEEIKQEQAAMITFDILAPDGRRVRRVTADGLLAELLTAHRLPGTGFDIQTWSVNLGAPPRQVTVEFE